MDVDQEQVVAFRLARHNLAQRLPPSSLEAAAAPCGIQETPTGSAALAFLARIDGLTPEVVKRALADAKTLVQLWSVRGAPYVVRATDLEVFTVGALPVDTTSFNHALGGWASAMADAGVDPGETLDHMVLQVSEVLDDRTLDVNDLRDLIYARTPALSGVTRPAGARADMPEPLFRALGTSGAVCIVAGRGTHAQLARTDQWLRSDPHRIDQTVARAELARRFLRSYGPASVRHFAEWTQRSTADAREAFELINSELVEVRFNGTATWLLGTDQEPLADPPEPRGVRLLPVQDPFLQQRDRSTLVPHDGDRPKLWRPVRGPGAVVLDGKVVGIWRSSTKGKRMALTVEAFGPLSAAQRDDIDADASRLAPFRDVESVVVAHTTSS